MIGTRIALLRKGKITEETHPHIENGREIVPDIRAEKIKKQIVPYTKKYTHLLIMTAIKTWVLASHSVQKKVKDAFPRVFGQKKIKEENSKENSQTSFFLHSVSEYKAKVKRLRQKVKERDMPTKNPDGMV